jgi:hypothetical protein
MQGARAAGSAFHAIITTGNQIVVSLLAYRRPHALPALVGAALSVVLSLAAAQAQVGRFEGGGTVFGFSQGCRDIGWQGVTLPFFVRYHPAGLGNNGGRETISFNSPVQSLSFALPGGSFTTSFQPVNHGGSFSHPFYFDLSQPNAAQIRLSRRAPSVLTANTAVPVQLTGQIRNWGGTLGCNVSFQATVGQRLN